MAFNSLALLIDVTDAGKSGIYASFDSRLPANLPLFIRNDGIPVSLRFVQPSVTTSRTWDDVDLSSYLVSLGLGEFDVLPSSGTFLLGAGPTTACTLNSTTTVTVTGSTAGITNGMSVKGPGIPAGTTCTISGSTVTLSQAATLSATGQNLAFYNPTTPLAFNISVADLATALNALPVIITAGGVTVSSLSAGNYLVEFVNPGAQSILITDPTGLNPTSSIPVSRVVVGSASVEEQQLIEIAVNPYALTNSWTPFPDAAAVVTEIAPGSGSTANVQSINLDPAPYDGTFQITTDLLTTAAIPSNATAAQVQAALNANGATYSVTGNANGPWTITAGVNGALAAYTVNVSDLLVPVGLTGVLELSTFAMAQRFLESPGVSNIALKFECQVIPPGGDQDTVLQLTCNVNKNVINFSRLVPSPMSAYPTLAQVNAIIAALNLGTVSTLAFDTDPTLAANSDARISTQKAVKTAISNAVGGIWLYKTGAYSAVAGDKVQADTSGAAWSLQTPVTPTVGAGFQVEDATLSWGTNNLTIVYNGTDKINGTFANYVANVSGGKLSCVYVSTAYGWSIK